MDTKELCRSLRAQAGTLGAEVKALAETCKTVALPADGTTSTTPPPDRGEMIANSILAFRHLEDARMRLGKVIQALDGGVSVYEK